MLEADEIVAARWLLQRHADEQSEQVRLKRLQEQVWGLICNIEDALPAFRAALAANDYPEAGLLDVSIGTTVFDNPKRPIPKRCGTSAPTRTATTTAS